MIGQDNYHNNLIIPSYHTWLNSQNSMLHRCVTGGHHFIAELVCMVQYSTVAKNIVTRAQKQHNKLHNRPTAIQPWWATNSLAFLPSYAIDNQLCGLPPAPNAAQQHGRWDTQNSLLSKRIAAQKSSLSPPRINWEKKTKIHNNQP